MEITIQCTGKTNGGVIDVASLCASCSTKQKVNGGHHGRVRHCTKQLAAEFKIKIGLVTPLAYIYLHR